MGTFLFLSIQDLLLGPFPIITACILLFAFGYWVGNRKTKKLTKQLAKMEKKVMDLNAELLYGPPGKLTGEKTHSHS